MTPRWEEEPYYWGGLGCSTDRVARIGPSAFITAYGSGFKLEQGTAEAEKGSVKSGWPNQDLWCDGEPRLTVRTCDGRRVSHTVRVV